MLCTRLEQMRAVLPARLRGILEFEVATEEGDSFFFHFVLDGNKSTSGIGRATGEVATRVFTTEHAIACLLASDDTSRPAPFSIDGNRDLLTAFQTAVENVPSAASLISVRR